MRSLDAATDEIRIPDAMIIQPDNPAYQLTQTSISQDWTVTGAAGVDEWTVRAAILATVPQANAPPTSPYAWPIRGLQIKEKEASTGFWRFTVTWGTLIYQVSGKIGGQQQQVRTSRVLTGVFTNDPKTIPGDPAWSVNDEGVPVGWDGRTVHGCSIYVPQETWSESVEIPLADFTDDYKNAVRAIVRSPVNSEPFRGLDANEVLFLGMQYQISTQNPDYVSASFEFSASENLDGEDALTVGSITGITKKGWDFLDVHMPVTVGANPVMTPDPDYVLTHEMYYLSDFSGLNIGTSGLPLWQGGGD
jgi:hypothetical protein